MHLRQHHNKARGKTYRYYQCMGGGSSGGGGRAPEHETNTIKSNELEKLVEMWFITAYGRENVKQRILIPASDHQKEIDERIRAAEGSAPGLVDTRGLQ